MKSVNIAKFKTELGKYLGFVRKGEEIIVLDRKEPLARVTPFRERKHHELEVEEALLDPNTLFAMRTTTLDVTIDSLEILKIERSDR